MSDQYMIWGGAAPGGWCPVWNPGMELHRPHPQTGSHEQAEETAARLRTDYPGFSYEVMLYDPAREPVAVIKGKLTKPQYHALKDTADGKNPFDCNWPNMHTRSTLNVLFRRGLIMHDETIKSRVRITRAGHDVLRRSAL